MKICMPIEAENGLDSIVFGHFGSAPGFIMFDAETEETQVIDNNDKVHEHGACNPLSSFEQMTPDIVVVGGIGAGALVKLNQAGIKVFQASGETVRQNINELKTKGLPEFTLQSTCQGHSHGEGCAH